MSDHRAALENIMRLCGESRVYTRRTQQINNVAMKALGMTASQRHEVHVGIMDRVGDAPLKDAYLRRKAKQDAKFATPQEAALHEDAHGAFHLDGVH
jgi:hypothetical protein